MFRVPCSIYSPRHGAGAGGPAGTVRADGASPWVWAAVPLVAGGPVSAAIGAVWSLSASARHVPIGTGALLSCPPPGVAVIPLLTIPAAQWTLTASPSPGTRRQGRAGALPTRATPTRGLALGARLVALGGLPVAPVPLAPLRGGAAALPSAFPPLLPLFPGLPWAAALLAAGWGRGGRGAAHTGYRLYLGGEHQLPAFRVPPLWLDQAFGWGGRGGSLLFALHRHPLLAVFDVLFLVPSLPIPRFSEFIRVLGLFPGVSVLPVLSLATFSSSSSSDVVPIVVGRELQPVPAPPLRGPGGQRVRESVRVGADIIVLNQRLHCVDTRRRRIAEGKTILGRRLPIMFVRFMSFAFRGRGHRRF